MRMMMMNPKNSKSVEYEGKKKHKKKTNELSVFMAPVKYQRFFDCPVLVTRQNNYQIFYRHNPTNLK